MNIIGENLKRLMRTQKVKQPELAKKAGLHQPDISRIANGHIDAKLSKLALALEVELEEFTKPIAPTLEMSMADFVATLNPEQRQAFEAALGLELPKAG